MFLGQGTFAHEQRSSYKAFFQAMSLTVSLPISSCNIANTGLEKTVPQGGRDSSMKNGKILQYYQRPLAAACGFRRIRDKR